MTSCLKYQPALARVGVADLEEVADERRRQAFENLVLDERQVALLRYPGPFQSGDAGFRRDEYRPSRSEVAAQQRHSELEYFDIPLDGEDQKLEVHGHFSPTAFRHFSNSPIQ